MFYPDGLPVEARRPCWPFCRELEQNNAPPKKRRVESPKQEVGEVVAMEVEVDQGVPAEQDSQMADGTLCAQTQLLGDHQTVEPMQQFESFFRPCEDYVEGRPAYAWQAVTHQEVVGSLQPGRLLNAATVVRYLMQRLRRMNSIPGASPVALVNPAVFNNGDFFRVRMEDYMNWVYLSRSSYERVVVPIHMEGGVGHWAVGIVDIATRSVVIYDSMPDLIPAHRSGVVRRIQDVASVLINHRTANASVDPFQVRVTYAHRDLCNEQQDGYNCGVFAIYNTLRYLEQVPQPQAGPISAVNVRMPPGMHPNMLREQFALELEEHLADLEVEQVNRLLFDENRSRTTSTTPNTHEERREHRKQQTREAVARYRRKNQEKINELQTQKRNDLRVLTPNKWNVERQLHREVYVKVKEERNICRRSLYADLPEQAKEQMNASRREEYSALPDEAKEEMNASRREEYSALPDEAKEEMKANRREEYSALPDEAKEEMKASRREEYSALPDEAKEEMNALRREEYSALPDEVKELMKASRREEYSALPDEAKEEMNALRREEYLRLPDEQKVTQTKKKAQNRRSKRDEAIDRGELFPIAKNLACRKAHPNRGCGAKSAHHKVEPFEVGDSTINANTAMLFCCAQSFKEDGESAAQKEKLTWVRNSGNFSIHRK